MVFQKFTSFHKNLPKYTLVSLDAIQFPRMILPWSSFVYFLNSSSINTYQKQSHQKESLADQFLRTLHSWTATPVWRPIESKTEHSSSCLFDGTSFSKFNTNLTKIFCYNHFHLIKKKYSGACVNSFSKIFRKISSSAFEILVSSVTGKLSFFLKISKFGFFNIFERYTAPNSPPT